MSYTVLAHVATGDLATAALHNALLDDLAVLKTPITDLGQVSGEIKNYREEVTTLTIAAGVLALDLTLSNSFKVSLVANVTSITISNWTASKATSIFLHLTQDATGGRTVAFPAAWKWDGGVVQAVPSAANKHMILVLYSDDGGATIFAAVYIYNA